MAGSQNVRVTVGQIQIRRQLPNTAEKTTKRKPTLDLTSTQTLLQGRVGSLDAFKPRVDDELALQDTDLLGRHHVGQKRLPVEELR